MNNKRNIYLMYIIVFLQGFVFYGPIATVFRENRGVSIYQIFLIESISMILIMLFEVPWGIFADKFGYKKTLVISNFIFFISKIVFFKANSFWIFLFERILLSISISGLSGCDTALIYLSLDKNQNSERVFGRYVWFSNVGFLLGSMISTYIINISIDLTAYYTIIPYGIAFGVSLFLKNITDEVTKKENVKNKFKYSLKHVAANKYIIIFLVGISLVKEVVQSITVFLNQQQYIKSGIDIRYFGILLVAIQFMKLISVKSYKLSNMIGQIKSINMLTIAVFISSSILIIISNAILSFLFVSVISIGMAIMEPMIIDIKNKSISSGNRATILSIYSMIESITSSIINPIIGFVSNSALENGLIACSLISLAAIILIRYFRKINIEN
ncbi:major facilitator superfamily protein [Clostridium sartagoforme AAU1]|uniref:Major facilitator superfamily protein n=1 Tax=Clostridium sartagoforme AAU1 TaxID=1202534 RepID=R9C8E6_9CLOT|nr:MFS transporter [Clostridium sartagoforme]EOR25543.1 major facilitator superfamily protein [Clostridium sartagoforme AAU1]